MKNPSKILTVVLTLWSVGSLSGQSTTSAPTPNPADQSYVDRSQELERFLRSGLDSVEANDPKKTGEFLKASEIPKGWFRDNFGAERGEGTRKSYQDRLSARESELVAKLKECCQGSGKFIVLPPAAQPTPGGVADTSHPVPMGDRGYYVGWRAPDGPVSKKGDPIGYFVYFDGGFRWNSLIGFAPSLEQGMNTSGETARVVINNPQTKNAKIVQTKFLQAELPPEVLSRRLSGKVAVAFTIGADGSVVGAHAVSGRGLSDDPALIKAAVDAVSQWRFVPPVDRDGNSVDVPGRHAEFNFPPGS